MEQDHGYKWRLAGFLFFSSALNYGDRTAITALYPLLQKDLALTDLGLAAIGSAFLWSYATCSPIAGILADRFSRTRLVLLSLFAWSIVTAMTGLAPSAPVLWTMRGALGVVESLYIPAAVALLAARHGTGTRATAIGVHMAGLSVGMVAGGTISGYLASRFGWRMPLFMLGGVGILIALAGSFILHGDEETSSVQIGVEDSRASLQATFASVAQALLNPAVLVLFFEIMFMGAGIWGLINWLPLYFHDTFGMTLGKAALFGSLFLQVGATLGVLAGGWPSDYFAQRNISRRMLLFGLFYLLAAPSMLIFLTHPGVWAISLAVFWFGLLRGMGSVNSNPLVCELLPQRTRATAIGLMNMLACMAGGLGVMVAGALKHNLGLAGVFASITFITGTCAAVLLLVSFWMTRSGIAVAHVPPVQCVDSLGGVAAINNEG